MKGDHEEKDSMLCSDLVQEMRPVRGSSATNYVDTQYNTSGMCTCIHACSRRCKVCNDAFYRTLDCILLFSVTCDAAMHNMICMHALVALNTRHSY